MQDIFINTGLAVVTLHTETLNLPKVENSKHKLFYSE